MSLTLYFDHHIKFAIIEGLRRWGFDVLTAQEDGFDRTADDLMLERATALGRVLGTQDKDFFRITDKWWQACQDFAGVIYVRQQNESIGGLIEDIALIAESFTPEEMQNAIKYVPL
jgi:hypothetical protein